MKAMVTVRQFFELVDQVEECAGTIWEYWVHDKILAFHKLNGEKLKKLRKEHLEITKEFFVVEEVPVQGGVQINIVYDEISDPARDEGGNIILGAPGQKKGKVPKLKEGKTMEEANEVSKKYWERLVEIYA